MHFDPLAQQVGVGGVVAVALVATVMKFLPAFMRAVREQKHEGNGNGRAKAGSLSPEEWEGRMRDIQREAGALLKSEIEKMFEIRDILLAEKLRRAVEEEIRRQ